jgi:hypothetical protein
MGRHPLHPLLLRKWSGIVVLEHFEDIKTCLRGKVTTFASTREKSLQQLFSRVRENEEVLLNQPVKVGCAKQAVIM